MKKEDLIKKLQQLPDGIEVCIFDTKLNVHEDSGDESGCSIGIYKDFTVSEMPKSCRAKKSKPFAILTFEAYHDYENLKWE